MSRPYSVCSVLLGLVIVAGAANAPGQSATPTRSAKFNGILTTLASRADSPGGVLLVQTRTSTWRGTVGLARLSPRTPMKPSGRFRVSGVGIPYTAALVLRLVADGTLSFDDTVEKWLPGEFRAEPQRRLPVRHLLGQTGGLVDVPEAGGRFVVERPPGAFRFVNANYNLLPEIVGAATSSTFAEQLARRILVPLRLTSAKLLGPTGALPGESTADGRRTVVALLNVGELTNTVLVRQHLNTLLTRALCT